MAKIIMTLVGSCADCPREQGGGRAAVCTLLGRKVAPNEIDPDCPLQDEEAFHRDARAGALPRSFAGHQPDDVVKYASSTPPGDE